MPPEARPELEKELAEIRREVIESRNLVIKTDNLLKNLHAEVKAVGKRQEDSERKQWLSSAVAYLLFTALCLGGSVLFVTAKGSAAKEDRERLEKAVADLTQLSEKQKGDSNAATVASRQAAEVYRLMTTLPGDERLKGVDELLKLDQSRLSSLEKQALSDRAVLLRKEIGQAALERGRVAFKRSEMQPAISELTRFMAMNPTAEDSQEAAFMLGAAYSQVKKYDQAIPLLVRYISDRKAKTRDYAMLLLALSYEQTGQLEKAAETSRDALGTYANSEYIPQLKLRLTIAKRLMSGATPDGGAAAAPAPGVQAAKADVKAPGPEAAKAPDAVRPADAARAPLKPGAAPLPAQ